MSATTYTTDSRSTDITYQRSRKAVYWPAVSLFLLLFILFVCASVTLGTYAYFSYVQTRLLVMVPWYYYFMITVTSITIAVVMILVSLYYIGLLLPLPVALAAFVMFTLWLTGLVKSSIELWGPLGSINDNCVRFVYQPGFWGGKSIDTIARIQQEGMCNLWKTVFALELIATVLWVWLGFMSWQVRSAAVSRSAEY